MIKTLDKEMTFTEALENLHAGNCIGIRPSYNAQYIVRNIDGFLRWERGGEVVISPSRLNESFCLVVEVEPLPLNDQMTQIRGIIDNPFLTVHNKVYEINRILIDNQ